MSLKKITALFGVFGLVLINQATLAYDCVMPKKSDIQGVYDSSDCIFDGVIRVNKDGKYGAMDNRHIVIVPLMFDEMGEFDDGIAKVRYGNKFGFINYQGLLVVPLKYDDVGVFQNDSTLVRLGDEYFMVDKQGQRVLDDTPVTPPADLTPPKDLSHLLIHNASMPEPMVN